MLYHSEHGESLADERSKDPRNQWDTSTTEVPAHMQILEDLCEKFELDPEIARDLGDTFLIARDLGNMLARAPDLGEALLQELEKAQVAADKQEVQPVSSRTSSDDDGDNAGWAETE